MGNPFKCCYVILGKVSVPELWCGRDDRQSSPWQLNFVFKRFYLHFHTKTYIGIIHYIDTYIAASTHAYCVVYIMYSHTLHNYIHIKKTPYIHTFAKNKTKKTPTITTKTTDVRRTRKAKIRDGERKRKKKKKTYIMIEKKRDWDLIFKRQREFYI